jgi:anti-sigma regulatory factor (Ser/Thr protein kinase)
VAEFDWSESDFGPRDDWDPAVEALVRTLIEATAPMAYCHGADYAMVYNDRFADLLGARHPRSWGQHATLVMPEIWSRPGYAEAVAAVFGGGPSFHDDGEMLSLRGGQESQPDWAYLARSYSAVRDDEGSVLGVLIVVVETAPVLVLVGGAQPADEGAARWRGIELWDETLARQPLIWSGFRTAAGLSATPVSKPDQRFVADGSGQSILPLNGPDIEGTLGYSGVRRHLPDIQMLTLAARGQSTTETSAGGEFYDVFDMPDGRLAVAIGDVKGAGGAAASVGARVRASLRTAALTSSDPNVIFTSLDKVIGQLDRAQTTPTALRTPPGPLGNDKDSAEPDSTGFGGELFVTALLGVFDPASGELLLASAGNLPPAVVRRRTPAGGPPDSQPVAEYVTLEPGPPLGITGTRPVGQIVLQEGDALIGYTRGLLEAHEPDVARGPSTLLQALTTMSATAARSISQHVVDTLIGNAGLQHDFALLVVVHDSRVHKMASVLVPPHTIAVHGARRWARAQLESWGVSEDVVTATVICVSELVTNVLQHAGTSARVTMELAGRLLVTVEDTGTWSTPRLRHEDSAAAQGRGLALVEALSDAMGHARGVDGSTVWCEFALDRDAT